MILTNIQKFSAELPRPWARWKAGWEGPIWQLFCPFLLRGAVLVLQPPTPVQSVFQLKIQLWVAPVWVRFLLLPTRTWRRVVEFQHSCWGLPLLIPQERDPWKLNQRPDRVYRMTCRVLFRPASFHPPKQMSRGLKWSSGASNSGLIPRIYNFRCGNLRRECVCFKKEKMNLLEHSVDSERFIECTVCLLYYFETNM